tara:strand:+ start:195 stop:338 length:144 start_codon:yes stop_codon:yes gene_type:complete
MGRRFKNILKKIKLKIRYKKCPHTHWNVFNSGYKQCEECKQIKENIS